MFSADLQATIQPLTYSWRRSTPSGTNGGLLRKSVATSGAGQAFSTRADPFRACGLCREPAADQTPHSSRRARDHLCGFDGGRAATLSADRARPPSAPGCRASRPVKDIFCGRNDLGEDHVRIASCSNHRRPRPKRWRYSETFHQKEPRSASHHRGALWRFLRQPPNE